MSTRKQVLRKTPKPAIAELGGSDAAALPPGDLENIEVTALELDERLDVDTDPYNRTGSHFVAALRRKDD